MQMASLAEYTTLLGRHDLQYIVGGHKDMGKDDTQQDPLPIGTIYEEYVRLNNTCNDYIKSALSDIRLFGSIGLLLSWDPLARLLELDEKLQQPVTPIGFIVLLLVILMVMFYDLLKQSIFFFHMRRMRELEHVLNMAVDSDRKLFHLAGGWPDWFRQTHMSVAKGFFTVFYLVIVGFPCAILYIQDYPLWVGIYFILAVILLTAHARTAAKVLSALEMDEGAQDA